LVSVANDSAISESLLSASDSTPISIIGTSIKVF
jgi:hypothetical protein